MRNSAFEKWKPLSTVLPPTGIVSPREVAVGVAASDQVLLQIGWYTTSRPNSDGPDVRETPTPSSYAAACPGSCGILRRSVVGALGCDVRLAVASHPMRHPDPMTGRWYLTCRPHRLVKSRLCSSLGRCKNCCVLGSQNASTKVTSCVILNRSCRTTASKDRSPTHSFRRP